MGYTSQNKVLSALRGTEVVADPTNVMALECARRMRRDPGTVVRLATSHRCVRAQPVPQQRGFAAHFRMFAIASAGLEQSNNAFVVDAFAEHIATMLQALDRLEQDGFVFPNGASAFWPRATRPRLANASRQRSAALLSRKGRSSIRITAPGCGSRSPHAPAKECTFRSLTAARSIGWKAHVQPEGCVRRQRFRIAACGVDVSGTSRHVAPVTRTESIRTRNPFNFPSTLRMTRSGAGTLRARTEGQLARLFPSARPRRRGRSPCAWRASGPSPKPTTLRPSATAAASCRRRSVPRFLRSRPSSRRRRFR